MSEPKTLLQMAGAKLTPPPLATAALVLIDLQREYVDGRLPLPDAKPALAAAAALLALVRKAGRPVIHIQHRGRAGGLFDPDGTGFAIAGPVAPQAGETVLNKALPNSFAGTELDRTIKATGANQVIFAGFMTHMCVSSTARAALDLGYGATVVAAACATRDLPDGRGGVITAAEVHRVELAALADRFAIVAADAGAFGG